MKKIYILLFALLSIVYVSKAQHIYPIGNYTDDVKDMTLNGFDLNDSVLFIPLGESGLQMLDISDINNIHELGVYSEYEIRSRKRVYGIAYNVEVINNIAYLSYGPLGLKILDISDPSMPFPIGKYYRFEDVFCTEVYDQYVFLGYKDMGLEIIDVSNLSDIKMVSRNNVKDFKVQNIQLMPPYVFISGKNNGVKVFKFREPFSEFKTDGFPRDYIPENEVNKFLVKGKTGYIANDFRGLTVVNIGLPLYPVEVFNVKTAGKAIDMILDKDYLYVVCGKSIEVYDIKEPEKPFKTHEFVDKSKQFVSVKMKGANLYALYDNGRNSYGIMIFQVE